ncbi:MAG: sigma-70 family RNA polymerase sigma factor [Solirubrobacterales bacterium]|nr:sigma-70 family RNA polymerase sigma factor [Solirubrobacterales bacterium]
MGRPRGSAAKGQATTRRLVRVARRGDRRAEDELVRRYEPLVQHSVRKLKLPPWCEREDVVQEARLGLVMAMRAWRPERGAFPAFARQCVRNQAMLAVISASSQKHQALNLAASLEENIAEKASEQRRPLRLVDRIVTSGDTQTDPESRLLIREEIDSVVRALPTLTRPELAAMSGGLNGHTYGQLAQALGSTPKAASQAAYRATRKLAAALPQAA